MPGEAYLDAIRNFGGGGGGGGGSVSDFYRPASTTTRYHDLGPSTQRTTPEYFNTSGLERAGGTGQTPTGQDIPTSSYAAWQQFIKSNYGMDPQDFLQSGQDERYSGFAQTQGLAQTPGEIPTGESGMPDRPPGSPQEAAMFQWQSGEVARQKNEELLNRAMAAYQYALGTLRQGGPGSLYQATQPIHGQMAQTLSGSEYTQPDFSFWLTPQAYGG